MRLTVYKALKTESVARHYRTCVTPLSNVSVSSTYSMFNFALLSNAPQKPQASLFWRDTASLTNVKTTMETLCSGAFVNPVTLPSWNGACETTGTTDSRPPAITTEYLHTHPPHLKKRLFPAECNSSNSFVQELKRNLRYSYHNFSF